MARAAACSPTSTRSADRRPREPQVLGGVLFFRDVQVVLVLLIVLAILGAVFHGRSLAAIAEGLAHAPQGTIPREIDAQIHNPLLLTSISSMSFAILGAVALMTVKPGLRDAIIVVGVSLVLGAGIGQFVARREETAEAAEVALG
jgi:uncharacterized protein YneF (UPF0154 family)